MATYQELVDCIIPYLKLKHQAKHPDSTLSINEQARLKKEVNQMKRLKKAEINASFGQIWDSYGRVANRFSGLILDETQFTVTQTALRYSGTWMRGYIGKYERECYVEILLTRTLINDFVSVKDRLIRNAKPGDKFVVSGNAGFCATSYLKGSYDYGDWIPVIVFVLKDDLSLSLHKL